MFIYTTHPNRDVKNYHVAQLFGAGFDDIDKASLSRLRKAAKHHNGYLTEIDDISGFYFGTSDDARAFLAEIPTIRVKFRKTSPLSRCADSKQIVDEFYSTIY